MDKTATYHEFKTLWYFLKSWRLENWYTYRSEFLIDRKIRKTQFLSIKV